MSLIDSLQKSGLSVFTEADLFAPNPVHTPHLYVGIDTNEYAKWLVRRAFIRLDGVVVQRCVVASAAEDFVEIYRCNHNGDLILNSNNDALATDILSGNVEIIDEFHNVVHKKDGMFPFKGDVK